MRKRQTILITLALVIIAQLGFNSFYLFRDNTKLEHQRDSVTTRKQEIIYEPIIVNMVPDITWNDSTKQFFYTVVLYNIDGTRVSDSYEDSAKTMDDVLIGLDHHFDARKSELLTGYYIEDFIPCCHKMRAYFKRY